MKIGILGGTFNPPHFAHIRNAIEAYEALNLDCVYLSPSPIPPQKKKTTLLPYEFRTTLLAAAIENINFLKITDIEKSVQGKSFSYYFLQNWNRQNPSDHRPYFLMGSESFCTLDTWFRGKDLPSLANLVMLSRNGIELTNFTQFINKFWEGQVKDFKTISPIKSVAELTDGGLLYYITAPRLDISSTLVRERWLAHRNLQGIVPNKVLSLLEENKQLVRNIWESDIN